MKYQLSLASVYVDIVDRVVWYKKVEYPLPVRATRLEQDGRKKLLTVTGDGWEFTALFRLAPVAEIESFVETLRRASAW